MVSSVSIFEQVADAVKDQVERLSLSMQAQIETAIVPSFDLEDLAILQVAIVSRSETSERLTRGGVRQRDVIVELGILYRVGSDRDGDAKRVLRVVGEIADGLIAADVAGEALSRIPGASLMALRGSDPAYDPTDFRERGQITAILVAVYRIFEG